MDASLLSLIPTQYLPWITCAVTVACVLATLIPPPPATPQGDLQAAWSVAYRLVNWVALNFGHGRNVTDPVAPAPTPAPVPAPVPAPAPPAAPAVAPPAAPGA
jgi:hypothetical protein